jgi:glycosyltransferase involved in cell wall biosynthesis
VIYFLPVKKEYLKKWVYYNVDLQILKSIYKEVYICNNTIDIVKNIFKSDHIFCWWWHQSFIALLLSKIFNKKILVTGALHMFDYSGALDYYKKSFIYKFLNKLVLRFADVNLFISNDQMTSVSSHLYVNNPNLLYSSLEPDKVFNEGFLIEKKANCKKDKFFRFSSVTWLTKDQLKRKNIIKVLEALKLFKNEFDGDWEYVIAGKNGDAYEDIISFINKSGLENNIKIRLDISAEDKNILFYKSDLLIMPSWFEGFGNSVLEAMSFGTPALVSRFGASPEVVDDSGIIINQISPEVIKDKLIDFVNLSFEERFSYYEKSYVRATNIFSFESRKKNLLKILNTK